MPDLTIEEIEVIIDSLGCAQVVQNNAQNFDEADECERLAGVLQDHIDQRSQEES